MTAVPLWYALLLALAVVVAVSAWLAVAYRLARWLARRGRRP